MRVSVRVRVRRRSIAPVRARRVRRHSLVVAAAELGPSAGRQDAQLLLELVAMADHVKEAMLEQELGGLEALRQLGADGLTDAVRDQANFLLSFGQQTWPHMFARVMLLEQISIIYN